MMRGLTTAGLGAVRDVKHLIQLASAHDFECVDMDIVALLENDSIEQVKALLDEHGVILGAIGLPVEWRASEEQFRADLVGLARAAEAAAKLGGTRCCTYILPSVDTLPAHFMAIATRRLRICAQILGAYGLRLGLEFVGPHHLRTQWTHPFIWTMEETLDWIDAIGEPNVGLLFDAYHWYTTGMTVEEIEGLRPEQIVHVHLNDARDVPIQEVLDNDRLYPGEGVIDLPGFLRGLQQIGYRGPVAQEILTPSAPKETPEELIVRSKAGYDKVFAAAGIK